MPPDTAGDLATTLSELLANRECPPRLPAYTTRNSASRGRRGGGGEVSYSLVSKTAVHCSDQRIRRSCLALKQATQRIYECTNHIVPRTQGRVAPSLTSSYFAPPRAAPLPAIDERRCLLRHYALNKHARPALPPAAPRRACATLSQCAVGELELHTRSAQSDRQSQHLCWC